MTIKKCLRFSLPLVALFAFAGIAAAQTNIAPTLQMNATVQTSVQLVISTHTTGATVTPGAANAFSVNFGNVNGLGLGTGQSANVAVTANGTGAVYTTPIFVTANYSGFDTETADIQVTNGASGDENLAVEGSTAANVDAVTDGATVVTGALSGVNNTRYIGFSVPRAQVAGAIVATFIYDVTIQ